MKCNEITEKNNKFSIYKPVTIRGGERGEKQVAGN